MNSNNWAHLSYHKSLDVMEFSLLGESHFDQASKPFIVPPKDMAKYNYSIKILRERDLWNHKHDSLKSVNATVLALAYKLTNISHNYRITKRKQFIIKIRSNENVFSETIWCAPW